LPTVVDPRADDGGEVQESAAGIVEVRAAEVADEEEVILFRFVGLPVRVPAELTGEGPALRHLRIDDPTLSRRVGPTPQVE
jgi:hypothetical protein